MNNHSLSNIEGALSRKEMKSIIAGSGGGNTHCTGSNGQYECEEGDLIDCTDACVDTYGDDCGGCATFPEEHP